MRAYCRLSWSHLVVLGIWVVGCGGDGAAPGDAGVEAPLLRRGQPLVAMTDDRGVVRVGGSAADQSPVLVVDAETQKPIVGAMAEAVAEDEDDGFLVRLSKDAAGYQPEIVRVRRGQPKTVPMGPATPNVPGRAVRVSARVTEDELLGEFDLAQVTALAEVENRPEIVFLPALPAGAMDVTMSAGLRFAVYRAALPRTLLALTIEGSRPQGSTVVRGQARVVSMSGARRGGARVQPVQVSAAGERHTGEDKAVPAVSDLTVTPPDAAGASVVRWQIADPEGRLLGVEVGIDTTGPARRLGRDVRELPIGVLRGDHMACIRPVFSGSDVDPVVRCLSFFAENAPAAPNVRVSVRAGDPTATARRGMPVVVEVENQGSTDAPGFPVDVVVSRDGRLEGGLGEVRTIWIDGVKAGGRTTRTTDVTAPRDGQLFVVARADGDRSLIESNAEDNLDRLAINVHPAGTNRAPVMSMAGTAVGSGRTAIVQGEPLRIRASAQDTEDGDSSGGIGWWSSRDGHLGIGPGLDSALLSPGRHRIRAEVADRGRPAAGSLGRAGRGLPAQEGGRLRAAGLPGTAGIHAAEEAPELGTAEMEVQILARDVTTSNSPPRLSAGPDVTTGVGVEISPRSSASDPDGDPLTFTWEATTLEGEMVPLLDTDRLRPRFSASGPGVYRLTVRVSDGKLEERDDVLVAVLSPAANQPPRVTVDLPPKGSAGMPVTGTVTAVDDDQDGLTVSYALDRPPGSASLLMNADGRTPRFVPDLGGVYVLTARVEDGRGGSAVASARIEVEGGVVLPDGGVPDSRPPGDTDGGVITSDGRVGPDPGTGADAGAPLDAGAPVDVAQSESGTRSDVPVAPDTIPAACHPVQQMGCPGVEDACHVAPGGGLTCQLAGAGGEDTPCQNPGDCRKGTGCFAGPDGWSCRIYCDSAAPAASCTSKNPMCLPLPGSPYGTCQPPAPRDGGVVTCDPLVGSGCGRAEDTCYALAGGGEICLMSAQTAAFLPCQMHGDCAAGSGCFDGPDGRLCRPYCRLLQPECPGQAPVCMMIGRNDFGVCAVTAVQAEAGVQAEVGASDALTLPASQTP